MTFDPSIKIPTDERITATVSPATLKTHPDGRITFKNKARLRLCLDRFLLQSAGYPEDTRLSLLGAVRTGESIFVRFKLGKEGKALSNIKVRSGKSELAIHGSVIGDKLPAVRRAKCSFWINKDEDSITISIPTGVKAR